MKEITVNTTVGELVPEGNYCDDGDALCRFATNWQGNPVRQWSCNLKDRVLRKVGNQCERSFYKLKSCPKPPSEVKKNG